MNNLASSISQQYPPPVPNQPPPSRASLVSNARLWAQKAVDLAAKVPDSERNDECDEGCAAATHNLGEFAEMDGDIVEARRRYEEALGLSKSVGFKEGVQNSQAALKRLKKMGL